MPLRVHLTVAATTVVAVTLLLAAMILVLSINSVLVHTADSAAEARASQLATAVRQEGPGGIDHELLGQAQNVDIIQIVDSSNRVVIASPPTHTGALTESVPPEAQHTIYLEERAGDAEYRAAVRGSAGPGGEPFTIVVGAAEGPIQRTVALIALMCAVGFPVIMIGMAVLTYVLTGRTLRSVDGIRRHLAAAADGGLPHPRIPVPASGDETSALATTMNAMLDRINGAHRQQSDFVETAARELLTPVHGIVDGLASAVDHEEAIEPDKAGTLLANEVTSVKTIVAELLLSSRPRGDLAGPPGGNGTVTWANAPSTDRSPSTSTSHDTLG
ncbi:Sensor histidine kinase component HK2 [Gordonia insulae]|uniref:histidine kinase n=2 Tax=Gordonia insulae TaxID=2420509 RepID=A0A3G8JMH4_9ACTN|nr:Sensor histidine kinase component HK2 [Gordonia insulae]